MCLIAKWCSTLYNPMDYGAPGSLCSWDFPGNDTGVGCHFLLWGIFLTQNRTCVSCFAGRFFTCWASFCILLMLPFILLFTLICIRVGIKRIESSTGGGCQFKEIPNNLDLSKKLLFKKIILGLHFTAVGGFLVVVWVLSLAAVWSSLVEHGLQSSWASVVVALG